MPADEKSIGIEQTKDVLDFVFSFVEAVHKAKSDGKMSWSDARHFIEPVQKLFEAIDDIEQVLPEINDLDGEEYDELVAYVKDKWDYSEEELEWVVDTALDAGKSLLVMVSTKS